MGIGKALANLLAAQNTNVNEVAKTTGVNAQTLYSLIRRDSLSANIRDLARVAHHLGVTLDYFYACAQNADYCGDTDAEDGELAASIRMLDQPGKTRVKQALQAELARLNETDEEFQQLPGPFSRQRGCVPISRQSKSLLHSSCYYLELLDDSMVPHFCSGDILVVRADKEAAIGDVGIFCLDGVLYPRLRANGALIAYNPAFSPMQLPEDVDCCGLVVGHICLDM